VYKGNWKDGRREGYGQMMIGKKVLFTGYWKNDKKDG
jgi:hypothetical protein